MKHFFLELKIGLLVIIGVALVLATGYLAYTGISSIVDSIYKESKPDVKLSLIQELASDLEKAENGVRLYAYSKSKEDLKPYYMLVTGVDDQLTQLRLEGGENEQFLANMDTVADLVEKKIRVWNEMLPLYNVKQAEQYLDTISKELESKIEHDSVRKSRSIFRKIFQRSEKVEIDKEKIIRDIEKAKDEDKLVSEKIRNKEVQLASANNKLTNQLYVLIQKIEDEEINRRVQKAAEAEEMAAETYQWIGWFALSATLSLLLVIFVISGYIKKSGLYQEALIKAKNKAEDLARTKELFVANVSHEVRTPLNVISGFVNQLLGKSHDENTKKSLDIIKSSSDHLVRIINDILDFSKLESGKMKLEPVNFKLKEVFDEVYLLFENQANEKGLSFDLDINNKVPDTLFGDPVRLKQILINLLGNALKFTDKGKIGLIITHEIKNENQVDLIIKVIDTGIGIADDKIDTIFNDFTQVEGTTRKYGGTGLGLSIVKKIIDLHKGDIKISSAINKGTEFLCKLPYVIGDPSKESRKLVQEIIVPEKIKSLRMLVVDDEKYNRKLIGTILTKWNTTFDEAENGRQAVQKAAGGEVDVILMDKRMPVMDGLEAASQIRQNSDGDQTKPIIILITAESLSREDQKNLEDFGINTWLPKPFTEEDLLKILIKLTKSNVGRIAIEKDDPVSRKKEGQNSIDLSNLSRIAGGDELFVTEMLEKFIDSFEDGYKMMVSEIEKKDFTKAGDAAHKLVSPSRHIGAKTLVKILKEIEEGAGQNISAEELVDKAGKANSEFENVKDQILNYIANNKK